MGRMRPKRNIPIRMERCHERWFDDPMLNKGHWREACGFPADIPVWLEIDVSNSRTGRIRDVHVRDHTVVAGTLAAS